MEPLIFAPEPGWASERIAAFSPESIDDVMTERDTQAHATLDENEFDDETFIPAEEVGDFVWMDTGSGRGRNGSPDFDEVPARAGRAGDSERSIESLVARAPLLAESEATEGRSLAPNQMIVRPRRMFGESDDELPASDLLPPPAVRGAQDYIVWVQRALNTLFDLGLTQDGISGPQTRGAVREFQQRHGLVPDGVVGPKTEVVLVDLLSFGAKLQSSAAASACAGMAFPEILGSFEYDSARVLPSHQKQLIRIAACIVGRHGTAGAVSQVHLIGHTDASGNETYNEGLALSRAEAARKALKDRLRDRAPHLNLHREDVLLMTAESRGENQPRFSTDAENRRVEIFMPELQPPPPKEKPKQPKPRRDPLPETVARSVQVRTTKADSFPAEQRNRFSCVLAAAVNPEVDNDLYINGKDFIVRQLAQGIAPELPPSEFVRLVARERVRRDLRSPLFAPSNESDDFVAGSLKALDERILSGINLIDDQTQRNSELNVINPVLRQMQKFVSASQRDPKSIYFCYGIGQP